MLESTPGLPFELTYTVDGDPRTLRGVLPNEITFSADAYNALIRTDGAGDFGFQIYRAGLLAASKSVGPVSGRRSTQISAGTSGGSINVSSSP